MIGSAGGKKTLAANGREFFAENGKKSGKVRRKNMLQKIGYGTDIESCQDGQRKQLAQDQKLTDK
jgi:hypothetical protein